MNFSYNREYRETYPEPRSEITFIDKKLRNLNETVQSIRYYARVQY